MRVGSKFTATRERQLIALLSKGTSVNAAAKRVNITPPALRFWIKQAARGQPQYQSLVNAVIAGQRLLARKERTFIRTVTRLLNAGRSFRQTAKILNVTYNDIYKLVHLARGKRRLAPAAKYKLLVEAAENRLRGSWNHRPRCPHCGAALRKMPRTADGKAA